MAEQERCIAKGMLAGAIGGVVASWAMNVFMESAGPKIQQAAAKMDGSAKARDEQQGKNDEQTNDEPKVDATMKTADAVVSTVTGGRHLSMEEKQKGGPIVHYAFGGLMGALYGLAAECSSTATAGFGTAFAAALFAGADLWAVPRLHLSGSTGDAPVSSLATPFGAHMVYGVATEGVRRMVRAGL